PIRTVGLYLGRWGYTPQKPRRKSEKQDPQEVAEWLAIKYPEIEARARREDAEIQGGGEMGGRSGSPWGRGEGPAGAAPRTCGAGVCPAWSDARTEGAGQSLQRQHDLRGDQPRESAVHDLPGADERSSVHHLLEAVALRGGEEDLPDRGQPEGPRVGGGAGVV